MPFRIPLTVIRQPYLGHLTEEDQPFAYQRAYAQETPRVVTLVTNRAFPQCRIGDAAALDTPTGPTSALTAKRIKIGLRMNYLLSGGI
jgi:hypothetical protein